MLDVLRNTLLFFLLMTIMHFILDTIAEEPTTEPMATAAPVASTKPESVVVPNNTASFAPPPLPPPCPSTYVYEEDVAEKDEEPCAIRVEHDAATKELYDYVFEDTAASATLSQMYTIAPSVPHGEKEVPPLRVDEHWQAMNAATHPNKPLYTTSFEVIGNIVDKTDDDIGGFDLSGGWETVYEMI
jgi:hypothetical protein